jgi:mannose-1-phosphate guanylyltransferase
MKAMILAAGFGTRFRPATYELPKPLIPLCNQPLIGYALGALMEAGVRQVVVNLHHLGEPLQEWLEQRWGSELDLHFSHEETILGTGGGIRRVREWIGNDEFVLVNGDTVQAPPIAALIAKRREHDALAALLLRHAPAGDRYTPVWLDGDRVTGFGEGSGQAMMFAGCHVFSPRIFDHLPDRDFSGITEDVYIPLTRSDGGEMLAGLIDSGYWFDIGNPRRYLAASEEIRKMMIAGEVPLPAGSIVLDDSIAAKSAGVGGWIEASTLSGGVRVEDHAKVVESAVWDDSVIGHGAVVERSIIGRGVDLPAGATVRNVLVCRRLPGVEYDEAIEQTDQFVWIGVDPDQPSTFA